MKNVLDNPLWGECLSAEGKNVLDVVIDRLSEIIKLSEPAKMKKELEYVLSRLIWAASTDCTPDPLPLLTVKKIELLKSKGLDIYETQSYKNERMSKTQFIKFVDETFEHTKSDSGSKSGL